MMEEKTTNLEKVKEKTMMIARMVYPEADEKFPFIVIHPFLETTLWFEKMIADGIRQKTSQNLEPKYDLTNPEIYEEWLQFFQMNLDKMSDLVQIYMLWRDPWKLTFMRFCGEYLGEKDYAEYLAESWVTEENPNMDCNVSISQSIAMFKKCKKEYLMEQADLEHYNSLPDQLTVYRGVAEGRVKLGLSWTDNIDKARWFQQRFGNNNCLLELTVDKKDVIAYFNTRGEEEILLDVMKYKKQIITHRKRAYA